MGIDDAPIRLERDRNQGKAIELEDKKENCSGRFSH